METFTHLAGVTLLILAIVFGCRMCNTEMDAERCITVCNARVETYNDLILYCECRP